MCKLLVPKSNDGFPLFGIKDEDDGYDNGKDDDNKEE